MLHAATQVLRWYQDEPHLAHLQASMCVHWPTNVTMGSRSLHLHLHGLGWHCPALAVLYLGQQPSHPNTHNVISTKGQTFVVEGASENVMQTTAPTRSRDRKQAEESDVLEIHEKKKIKEKNIRLTKHDCFTFAIAIAPLATLLPYKSNWWAAFRTRSRVCSISNRDCKTSH